MKPRTSKFLSIAFLSISLTLIFNPQLSGQGANSMKINFVDYFFENASPINWEIQGDTAIRINVMYDYERETTNRQSTHWHFKIEADKGTLVRLIIANRKNIWNGRASTENPKQGLSLFLSFDGINWEGVSTQPINKPDTEWYTEFIMKGNEVFIARMPPYTITDLENFKARISDNPYVEITNIGKTVENRNLEMIRVGNPDAPHSIIIRVRAHPWETGGNFVAEGMIDEYLKVSATTDKWVKNFCIYIMPMANKDGVARGMTRFNLKGRDLNRNWDQDSDPLLCPEKYAFEKFISGLIKEGRRPDFGIDFHNDSNGSISPGYHDKNDNVFMNNIVLFEKLMRKYTSFSENITKTWETKPLTGPLTSFSNGMMQKYGFEAIVYELNANWIGSLNKIPHEEDYVKVGKNLNTVFYEYFTNMMKK